MVDPVLKGLYPAKSLSRFADVIALCVQVKPFIPRDLLSASVHAKSHASASVNPNCTITLCCIMCYSFVPTRNLGINNESHLCCCQQPEPEFRPPMSEVVQALVRLVQRANMSKRMVGGEMQETSRADEHVTRPDISCGHITFLLHWGKDMMVWFHQWQGYWIKTSSLYRSIFLLFSQFWWGEKTDLPSGIQAKCRCFLEWFHPWSQITWI